MLKAIFFWQQFYFESNFPKISALTLLISVAFSVLFSKKTRRASTLKPMKMRDKYVKIWYWTTSLVEKLVVATIFFINWILFFLSRPYFCLLFLASLAFLLHDLILQLSVGNWWRIGTNRRCKNSFSVYWSQQPNYCMTFLFNIQFNHNATIFTNLTHLYNSCSYFLSSLLILLKQTNGLDKVQLRENLFIAAIYAEASATMMIPSRASTVPAKA